MSDTEPTTQPPAPAPAQPAPTAPAPAAPAPAPAPATAHVSGDTEVGRVPFERFREANEAAKQARAEAEAAAAKAAAEAERAASLEARLRQVERGRVFDRYADRPDLTSPEVQRFVSEQYDKHAADAGESAPDFAAWMAEHAPNNPLLRAYFAQPTPPPASAPDDKAPPPNPNAGTTPDAGTPPSKPLTQQEIRELKAAGKWTADHHKALREDLLKSGVIKTRRGA